MGRAQRIQGKGLRGSKATPETSDPSLTCAASLQPADVRGEEGERRQEAWRAAHPQMVELLQVRHRSRVLVGAKLPFTAVSVRRTRGWS